MSAKPWTFRVNDVVRAIVSAKRAGTDVTRLTIEPNGKIMLRLAPPGGDDNSGWDIVIQDANHPEVKPTAAELKEMRREVRSLNKDLGR